MPSPEEKLRFQCACGKKLGAPRSAAGKRVRCPACRAVTRVPGAAEGEPALADEADPFADLSALVQGAAVDMPRAAPPAAAAARPQSDLYGFAPVDPLTRSRPADELASATPGRKCRHCGKEWPASARMCTACGLDLKTGRPIQLRDESAVDQAYIYVETFVLPLSYIIRLGIWPVASEAFGVHKPWVVRGVAILTILVSLWFFAKVMYVDEMDPGALTLVHWAGDPDTRQAIVDLLTEGGMSERDADRATRYRPHQLLTSALLHADILHLAGNLLFLMVLGARVNMAIGNVLTAILYPLLAVLSSIAHGLSMAHQQWVFSLGASGAVMGLAGMYLVLYPIAPVHMAVWFRAFYTPALKMFPVRGFWVVLFWIAFDVLYTVIGADTGTAHWAHLGGFIAGVAIALLLLFGRLAYTHGSDIITTILGHRAFALVGGPDARRMLLP